MTFRMPMLAVASLIAVTSLMSSTPSAKADTYTVYDLGGANALSIYGITTDGTVVISGGVPFGCGTEGFAVCYYTWEGGVNTAVSTVAPDLAFDDGVACTITGLPEGTSVSRAQCNNGHEGYGGRFDTPAVGGLFSGPDPIADLVKGGVSVDKLVVNALGDLAWTSGQTEENYEAIDLTSRAAIMPEPGSLALLGTGALGVVGVLRRRLRGAV